MNTRIKETLNKIDTMSISHYGDHTLTRHLLQKVLVMAYSELSEQSRCAIDNEIDKMLTAVASK